ncbi:MAG: M48 family metalloprotease [Alphaproteobacteria bacterium]|nr:M48 family metalloprotease [Alphaproteobacteria bacterium]
MLLRIALIFLTILAYTPSISWAKGVRILLDAEVQTWLEELAAPLLKASNIPYDSIHFHMIMDDDINAFATPGNRIFFNTGLILEASNTNEVRGVMAHEIAHIQAQHLFERYDDIATARWSVLAGALVGLGAAAAGSPDAALAGILGGQAYGTGNLLRHSRTQEREADNYAIQTLHKSGYSTAGMVNFFKKLRNNSLLTYNAPPPHLLTHPLPAERLDALKHRNKHEHDGLTHLDLEDDHRFSRIQAKIYAFTHTPSQTLRQYRGETTADKLAQGLAYLYQGKFKEAVERLRFLMDKNSDDPFLHELIGHISLDSGNLPQAEKAFASALQLNKNIPLIRYHYARSLQAQGKYVQALPQLQGVRYAMPTWPSVWYNLGTTFGKLEKLGESHLSLAEYYYLKGDYPTSRQQLELAKPYLDQNNKKLTAQKANLIQALNKAEKE